MIKDFFGRI